MLLQLRRAAQEATPIHLVGIGGGAALLTLSGDQLRDELWHDLDQNPTIGTLHVLKWAVLEPGRVAGGEGGEGGGGEDGVGDAVEWEEEVGVAAEELVVDGEGWDGVADEEGGGVADHVGGELEHYLPREAPPPAGEEPRAAAVLDELDGGSGRGAEAGGGGHGVAH